MKPGRGVVDKKQRKKIMEKITEFWGDIADLKNIEFPEKLVIYKAGEKRSSFISFWKATAIFQFGIVAVFLAPILYHNENQPDPNIRLLQAVGRKFFQEPSQLDFSYIRTCFTHFATSFFGLELKRLLHMFYAHFPLSLFNDCFPF